MKSVVLVSMVMVGSAAADPLPPEARVRIEAGPLISNFSAGLEGSVMLPIAPSLRAGVTVAYGLVYGPHANFMRGPDSVGSDGEHDPMVSGMLELRWQSLGVSHHELGVQAGAMTAFGDGAGVVGVRLGHVWEGELATTALSLTSGVVIIDFATRFAPVAWLTLRVGLRL